MVIVIHHTGAAYAAVMRPKGLVELARVAVGKVIKGALKLSFGERWVTTRSQRRLIADDVPLIVPMPKSILPGVLAHRTI